MRPLHTALLAIVLLALVGSGIFLIGSRPAGPEVASAVPSSPATPPSGDEDTDVELGEPASALAGEREGVRSAPAPAAPASEAPSLPRSEGEDQGGTRVRGRVLDPQGEPVSGARVLASAGSAMPRGLFGSDGVLDSRRVARAPWMNVVETTSASDGRFELHGLDAGELRIAVRAAGFAPFDEDGLSVPDEAEHELAPLQLVPGASLAGVVVDPTGAPVAGAEVVRLDGTGAQARGGTLVATSATDGSFKVDVLEVGPWSLRVEPDAHPDALLEGQTSHAGEEVQGLRVVLQPGLEISGVVEGLPESEQAQLVVTASSVGNLAGDADDSAQDARRRKARVSADGRFVLRGLRKDHRYALQLGRDRATDTGISFFVGSSMAKPIEATAGERGVRIEYRPEAALVFQVVDARSGAPIESFDVQAGIDWSMPLMDPSRAGRPLREHPEGRARFGGLRPSSSDDRAQLRVQAAGYEPYEVNSLRLTAGLDTDLGQIALEPLPLGTITVLDAASGEPVSGARVSLKEVAPVREFGTNRRSISMSFGGADDDDDGGMVLNTGQEERHGTTDENGVVELGVIAGRNCRLRVTHGEHALYRSEPFPCPAVAFEREVLMGVGGRVVVTLLDATGEPVPGGRVEHRPPAQPGLFVPSPTGQGGEVTNAEGLVVFEHLEPGEHRFRPFEDSTGVFRSGGNAVVIQAGLDDEPTDDSWTFASVVEGGEAFVELMQPLEVEVTGRITEGGEPLAGASVSMVVENDVTNPAMAGLATMGIATASMSAETDARGEFEIPGVEPGAYTLSVTHSDRVMPAEVPVSVGESGEQVRVDLPISIVEGRITNGAGEPLAGVRVRPERAQEESSGPRPVSIRMMAFSDGSGENIVSFDSGPGGGTVETDAEGRYSLRGVQTEVDLQVVAEGSDVRPTRSERFQVAANEIRRGVDVIAEPAGSVRVVGMRADGGPARNLLIVAQYVGHDREERLPPVTKFMDQSGSALLDGMAEGLWRLRAQSMGLNSGEQEEIPTQEVEIVAGEEANIQFDVP